MLRTQVHLKQNILKQPLSIIGLENFENWSGSAYSIVCVEASCFLRIPFQAILDHFNPQELLLLKQSCIHKIKSDYARNREIVLAEKEKQQKLVLSGIT